MKTIGSSRGFEAHDEAISRVAWLLAGLMAVCSSAFLYNQILTHPERPALASVSPRPAAPAKPAHALPAPKIQRMTLKLGRFSTAVAAVRFGLELGIDGHTFVPVRETDSDRYTLHFGEFTEWKGALGVMEAIRARKPSIGVILWPIPDSRPNLSATNYPS